jgi:uncharacterized protein
LGDISNEPSMEDILASIKRIIAEEPDRATAAGGAEAATMGGDRTVPAADDADDVLNLGHDQVAAPEEPQLLTKARVSPIDSKRDPVDSKRDPIVSPVAAEASRVSLSNLSRLIVRQEEANANTLEGLVRDMLKPMIKPWLDENLPAIVERVVAQEVARLSGRNI